MEVRDSIYCFEIARRSVGRAAYHLGMDSMSEATLDALADILLQYLNRVGRVLSHLVESSQRTSAHVNILDALRACEMVVPPNVRQLHLPTAEDEDEEDVQQLQSQLHQQQDTTNGNKTNTFFHTADWKGLAAVLFGPKWLEEELKLQSAQGTADATSNGPITDVRMANGAGGKQGPSVTGGGDGSDPNDPSQSSHAKGGWDAPYLDEVPHFPQASPACANPHPMSSHVGLSLHHLHHPQDEDVEEEEKNAEETKDGKNAKSKSPTSTPPKDAKTDKSPTAATAAVKKGTPTSKSEITKELAEQELKQVPDEVFYHEPWGSLTKTTTPTGKRKQDDAMDIDSPDAATAPPPKKKVKIDETQNIQHHKNEQDEKDGVDKGHHLSNVPSFYPPTPSIQMGVPDEARVVVDAITMHPTRSTLEDGDNNNDGTSTKYPTAQNSVRSSLVQLGKYWGSGWENNATSSSSSKKQVAVPIGRALRGEADGGKVPPAIVPLGRASGSRVSKILEGSMEASAMQ